MYIRINVNYLKLIESVKEMMEKVSSSVGESVEKEFKKGLKKEVNSKERI